MKTAIQGVLLAISLCAGFSATALATEVTVYKSPTCGCCQKWVEHMQANGFSVKAINTEDVVKHKLANGVPYGLGS